jgi:hypothetical protein
MQLVLQIRHYAFLDRFQPRLNPRDTTTNRTLEILLEPILHARDGLFDRDDPGVDCALQIAYESRLERLEALLDRSQVILEVYRRMLQERLERRE